MNTAHHKLHSGTVRISLLIRLAEESQKLGATTSEAITLMRQFNETRCDPSLSEAEFAALVHRYVLSPQESSAVAVAAEKPPTERLEVALLSQVGREEVGWLWPGRIPLGKVTVIAGEADLGKSLLSLDIAARVTRGTDWPEAADEAGEKSPPPPGRVLLLNADDHLKDDVGPRLEAAGAIMESIVAIKGISSTNSRGKTTRRGIDLHQDLPILREQLESIDDVRLVIIDPVTAYCGPIGRYPTGKSRRVVTALAELAEAFNVAILLITDLRNSGIPSRASWAVQRDPFDAELRLWLPVQFHFGPLPSGLGYRIREGRIEWDQTAVRLSAKEVMEGSRPVKQSSMQLTVVADWLWRFLNAGPRQATEVYDAGAAAGLSARQIWRAKSKLGVDISKAPNQFGKWIWELKPEGEISQIEGADPRAVTSL